MPITLGSNIASLRGQLGLNKVTSELRSVYERLSSGQRINRASDDAAGLAVSESLKADTRIYTQGIRNVNDGTSLLSIADSALENLSTIVTRLQELAEQASNGIYGVKQREALDAEAQTLAKEFTRIQQSTTFNGISLLNGSLSNLQIQAGIGTSAILDLGVGGKVGTGAFDSASNLAVNAVNTNMQLLDLNGDGNNDLISQLQTSDLINVGFGNGDGTFNSEIGYSTNANSTHFNLGDFNNDGIKDLVIANGSSASLDIRLGNSNGTFGSASTMSVGSTITEIDVGDINGDGNLDLVGSNSSGASLHILLGNGTGNFVQGTSVSGTQGTTDISLADFNGDKILDIVSKNSAGNTNLNVYMGDGDGTFGSASTIVTGVGLSSDLNTSDLNNDGLSEIIISSRTEGARAYFNQGNGTFNSATVLSTGVGNFNNYISSGDFNGDGNNDLVAGHHLGYRIFLNNGNNSFTASATYASGSSTVNGLLNGDINNDGVLDIIGSGTHRFSTLGLTSDGVAPILDFSLKTMADSKQALGLFKAKANLLSAQRGEIGAYQARLSTANNVLISARENFESAGAQIRDADIAAESSKLVRNEILQQAASSILGQANLQPELALRLLS